MKFARGIDAHGAPVHVAHKDGVPSAIAGNGKRLELVFAKLMLALAILVVLVFFAVAEDVFVWRWGDLRLRVAGDSSLCSGRELKTRRELLRRIAERWPKHSGSRGQHTIAKMISLDISYLPLVTILKVAEDRFSLVINSYFENHWAPSAVVLGPYRYKRRRAGFDDLSTEQVRLRLIDEILELFLLGFGQLVQGRLVKKGGVVNFEEEKIIVNSSVPGFLSRFIQLSSLLLSAGKEKSSPLLISLEVTPKSLSGLSVRKVVSALLFPGPRM
jgi:hypothetical protein